MARGSRLVGKQTGLTTTVSTTGQVILPKTIRELLHWKLGTRLTVEHTADGVLLPDQSMITLSGTFVVRRTCCSHEACESCDQTKEHDHAWRNVQSV
jgi:AbrB family looped-hinge helix DNA binding protein